jgi:hypothetical protein
MSLGGFAFIPVFLCIVIGIAAGVAAGPVARKRLERFAWRQRLEVTATNGDQIIRYLATTRRWRVAGFTAGYVLSIAAVVVVNDIGNLGFVVLFAGWFTGALVAEIRVAHLAHGTRRAASLRPRRPGFYLPVVAWALVPVAAGLAVAVAVATLVARASHRAEPDWWAAVWLVVALATAGTVRAVQRRVLRRPQPLAAPDVLAADDAIRSRSLHVLAGGGTALVLLCVTAQLDAIHLDGDGGLQVWREIGIAVAALLGWTVSTTRWAGSS